MLHWAPLGRLCASLKGWVVRSPAIMCSRIGPGGTARRLTGSKQDDGIGPMSVPPGVSTAFPSQRLGCSARLVEAMRWNWAVERPTYRRGWPVGMGVLSGSTTPRHNWLPRQDSKTSSTCASLWSTATPSGCRSTTRVSTSRSPNTAPPSGATPTVGCPKQHGCYGPVAVWCSSGTQSS